MAHGHDDAADHLDKLAKVKCSACATCCTAVALPTSVVNFEPQSEPAVMVSPLSSAAVTFLTGGPERPPRRILA